MSQIKSAAKFLEHSNKALDKGVLVDVEATTDHVVEILERAQAHAQVEEDWNLEEALQDQIGILQQAVRYPDSPEQAWREVANALRAL